MSARCSGGATTKMRSAGTVSETRSTVSCRSVRPPWRSRNCLGRSRRESGQRRVPAPPERMRTYSRGKTLAPEVIESHRLTDLVQCRSGLASGALAAGREDLVDDLRPRGDLRPALPDRSEEPLERREEEALHLDVGHLSRAVARFEVVDFGSVGVEGVVVDEDRVPLDAAGDV